MSYAERNTWVYGLVALIAYGTYLAIVLPQLIGGEPSQVAYQAPLLGTVGGAVAAGILGGIVLGAVVPKSEPREDVRDREISRRGERVGQGALVLGAVIALSLALLETETFWIANSIYLGFVAQAVLSSVVRILGHRGVAAW